MEESQTSLTGGLKSKAEHIAYKKSYKMYMFFCKQEKIFCETQLVVRSVNSHMQFIYLIQNIECETERLILYICKNISSFQDIQYAFERHGAT